MKIAATYEAGMIFAHFGHTETFKLYDVAEDGKVSVQLLPANGSGHSALAALLAENGVQVLICGGIGGGAQQALTEAGITVISGVEGSADSAVEAFLKGELTSAGVNCHHHEEGGCGCHEDGGDCHCGGEEGGCGHCGGGCGGMQPIMEGKNVGKTCRVHYTGTFNDGSKFDSSYDRGEPLEFTCGVGMMIRGFDAAVAEMEPGEVKDIHLMPEDAYGMPDPRAVMTFAISQLPGSEGLTVGQQVYLQNAMGQPFPVTVTAKDEENITLDANHAMAGKELNFRIELVEVC